MRLEYYSRFGKFNLLGSEETYSCHVAVYDEDNEKIMHTNFDPEYDLNGTDPEEILWEIQESLKRTWSTDKSRKECADFIKEHQEEIERGNDEYELKTVLKEVERLSKRAETISARIAERTKPVDDQGEGKN